MDSNMGFRQIEGTSIGYYSLVTLIVAMIAIGLSAAYYMEHNGHYVTGMTNQIVWGMPHIFAVFLIVAASGALNVASIASVFGRKMFKPLAPLSGLLAIALLVGGLSILVLDLGRPDRLLVAMTYWNLKSIFAWNQLLYPVFMVVVALYLWTLMEKRFNKYSTHVGRAAFAWRLILTTGTGSIFGFLVARNSFSSALMAPLFILMSFSFGLAIFNLVLVASFRGTGRKLGVVLVERLRRLLGLFVLSVLFFMVIFHLTKLYGTENHSIESFILNGDNVYTGLFWFGFVVIGSLIPLFTSYYKSFKGCDITLSITSLLVIAGGFCIMYVIIIGGQAVPLELFPGKEVSSSFYDGVVNPYTPSLPEFLLGLGGISIALFIVIGGIKILKFLPTSLANEDVDPHYKANQASQEESSQVGETAGEAAS